MRSLTLATLTIPALVVGAALAAPPANDPLAADWERFGRGPRPDPGYVSELDDGLREILWPVAHSRRPLAEAVDLVAQKFKIDTATATALIEATVVTRGLPEARSGEEPDPARAERAASAFWRAYSRRPSAGIVLQQAGWILFELLEREKDRAVERRVVEELRHSSDPGPLAARIAAAGLCGEETRREAIGIALGRQPRNPVLLLAASTLRDDDPCTAAEWAREALEAAGASDEKDAGFLETARNRSLATLLDAGALREAIEVHASILAGEVAAALGDAPERPNGTLGGLEYDVPIAPLRSSLAAAAFLTGRADLASRLVAAAPNEHAPGPRKDKEGLQMELVRSAIGRLSGDTAQDAFDILDRALVLEGVEFVRAFPTALLFARLARESDYPDMAEPFLGSTRTRKPDTGAALDRSGDRVKACRAASAEVSDMIARKLRTDEESAREADPAASIIARRLAAAPSKVFTERPLPPGIMTWEPSDDERERFEKSLAKWKLPGLWPVRVEQTGLDVIAIGLSQDYDPAGEVSGGGYWIVRSDDGGKIWHKPLYTGLRPMQPYVIRSLSYLPLAAGDRLSIEVEIRELDTSRITFPPIERSFTRNRTGLYLDVAWSDLTKDSDGDGLTDLAEERLMTDPHSADTDGDGLIDGQDPLPHIARSGQPSTLAGALVAVLKSAAGDSLRPILTGDPGGQGSDAPRPGDDVDRMHFDAVALTSEATMFVIADRQAFVGLSAGQRIIVLTPSEADLARERFGPHYPGTLRLYVDHSGSRALAIWDESWRGLTLRLTKQGGEWKTEVVSSWIS